MLKPKKKITRKEIKRDPLLDTVYNAQQWYRQNKNMLTRVVVGVVVIIVVVLLIGNRQQGAHRESAAALGKALVALQIGDTDNAQYQLELIHDEHPGTDQGILAAYHLGKLYLEQGDRELAREYLSIYTKKGSNKLLITAAYQLLADIAEAENNLTEAEKLLRKAIKTSDNSLEQQTMELALADLLLAQGKTQPVYELLQPILEDQETPAYIRQNAERISGRLNG